MPMLPVSGLIYLYSSFAAFYAALRLFKIYKKTESHIFHHIFYTAIGVGIGMFLWGLPMLIFNPASKIVVFSYLIAWIPAIFGLLYTLEEILNLYFFKTINKIIIIALLALISSVFVLLHFINPPQPYLDNFGLMHWRVSFELALFEILLFFFLTIYPGSIFIFKKLEEENIGTKKFLFGSAYLFGGVGGSAMLLFSNNIIDNTFLLALASVFQFFGFSALLALFLKKIF